MNRLELHTLSLLALLLFACTSESAPPLSSSAALGAFFASGTIADSRPVLAVRSDAKSGDEVVVRGRAKDFVAGVAAFTIVDPTLIACSDEGDPMEDTCKTPWDYCCTPGSEVAAASATIEFRDASGPIGISAEGFRGLAHLDKVVVRGKVERDSSGNMTVVASSFTFTPNSGAEK
jgi:hypothetical protein